MRFVFFEGIGSREWRIVTGGILAVGVLAFDEIDSCREIRHFQFHL